MYIPLHMCNDSCVSGLDDQDRQARQGRLADKLTHMLYTTYTYGRSHSLLLCPLAGLIYTVYQVAQQQHQGLQQLQCYESRHMQQVMYNHYSWVHTGQVHVGVLTQ